MKAFAAIDFECANECRSSVCSVGVVIVRDGQIVDSFYSLMAEYGSVFFSFPGALAAVNCLEDHVRVDELLCLSADPAGALAGIAAGCPAELYEVRTPVFFPGPGDVHPYAYVHDAAETMPRPDDFWYPFGLE